jgi:hypothetical protein
MAQTQARYEAYKRRFRELQGLPAEAPANVEAALGAGKAKP